MRDRYGREITYLRISVTEGCNLRCRYCVPEEAGYNGSTAAMLTEEEIVMAVESAAAMGVKKIRITGGEPLTRNNILSICRKTADVAGIETVCLTTNGLLLPKYAEGLKCAGVSRINLSLDTLQEKKYE